MSKWFEVFDFFFFLKLFTCVSVQVTTVISCNSPMVHAYSCRDLPKRLLQGRKLVKRSLVVF